MWNIQDKTTTGKIVINIYDCSCGRSYITFKEVIEHYETCLCGNHRETTYEWLKAEDYEKELSDGQKLAIAIIKEDYEEAQKIHNKLNQLKT